MPSQKSINRVYSIFCKTCLHLTGVQNCFGSPKSISVAPGSSPHTAKVTWDASGITCQISAFDIKYNSISPLRIFKSHNVTGGQSSAEIQIYPSFKYEVNVFGILKATGDEEGPRSPVTYDAPKTSKCRLCNEPQFYLCTQLLSSKK